MSKKANPTSIGLFIVIGLALGVAALITFSSGRWFSNRYQFIVYFDASLKGLNAGAPVKYRGVPVGSVVEVLVSHNQRPDDYTMPVIIEIDEQMVLAKSDRRLQLCNRDKLKERIQQGLRAKLDAESLVTGVLYVELEVMPDAPPAVFHQLVPEYPEIPSAPTDIQELLANLARFDIGGISDKLNALLSRLDSSLSQLNMAQINNGVTNLLDAADRLIGSPDLTNSIASLRQTLATADALLDKIDRRVDPMADRVSDLLHEAEGTLSDLRRGIQDLTSLVEPEAPFRADLTTALEQLGDAGRAIADLAEFLERNPNALLTGKKPRPINP
jgi:paraquat-inducible protein B